MWVESYLNRHDRDVIPSIFTPNFKDHDPIRVPTLAHPGSPAFRHATDYLESVVTFLASDAVDVVFTLEDAFAVEDRAAYRLFGEGTVGAGRRSNGTRSALALTEAVHITYQSVGMFRIEAGRFAERWGPVLVR